MNNLSIDTKAIAGLFAAMKESVSKLHNFMAELEPGSFLKIEDENNPHITIKYYKNTEESWGKLIEDHESDVILKEILSIPSAAVAQLVYNNKSRLCSFNVTLK